MSEDLTLEFKGETFRLSGQPPSHMAMLELAHLSEDGADTEERAAFAAIYNLIEDLVHPDDWGRFRKHARAVRASGDELMFEFARPATQAVVDRPSKRSSDSSDGPQRTEPSSTAVSSEPATPQIKSPFEVIEDLNRKGRPDLALVVRRRQEYLAGSR